MWLGKGHTKVLAHAGEEERQQPRAARGTWPSPSAHDSLTHAAAAAMQEMFRAAGAGFVESSLSKVSAGSQHATQVARRFEVRS